MNTINSKWFSIKPTYVEAKPVTTPRRGVVRHTEAAGEVLDTKDLMKPGGTRRETYRHTVLN